MAHTITAPGYARIRGFGTPSALLIGRTDFFEQLETDVDEVFFNQTEFGEMLSYYHAALGRWETYKDLFDDSHISMQLGADAKFNTLRPQAQIQESKLVHPIQKSDKVITRGVRYSVDDFISDGVGITTIYMHRQK